MTDDVPPLSKVPGYRPPVPLEPALPPDDFPQPGVPTMDLLEPAPARPGWLVIALAAVLVVIVLALPLFR